MPASNISRALGNKTTIYAPRGSDAGGQKAWSNFGRPQSSGAPSWSRNSGTYLPTAVNATKTGGNPAVGDNSMQLTMQSPQLHRLVNKRYYQIAPDVDAMTATVVDDDPTDRHSGPASSNFFSRQSSYGVPSWCA